MVTPQTIQATVATTASRIRRSAQFIGVCTGSTAAWSFAATFLWRRAYHTVNASPARVKVAHIAIRNGAPDSSGTLAMPWATATLKGFIQEVANPIWLAM